MINLQTIPEISGIYKFINITNNKVYIGQAVNLRGRISGHLSNSKYNKLQTYFCKSIRKHGIENFELEILQQGKFSKDDLNDLEIDFIRLYNSNNPKFGYNLTKGGEGIFGFKHSQQTKEKMKHRKDRKHSEETKKKIGEKSRSRKHTQETKDKISKFSKGRKHTEEAKEKIRQTSKGRKHSQETKDKLSRNIRLALKNKKPNSVSKETREKISNANKGKITSEQTKEKMRKSSLGKVTSVETRKKQSDIKKGKPLLKESVEKRTKTQKLNRARKLIQENCLYEEYFYDNFVYQS